VAVLNEGGAVVASGPGRAGPETAAAAGLLWAEATRRAAVEGRAELEHVVVPVADGAVAIVAGRGHHAVAVTGSRPAVALLLFDLRTCLGDVYAGAEETR
jgi:hypothetical protein